MRYDGNHYYMDSKEPNFSKYETFLDNEVRFNALKIKDKLGIELAILNKSFLTVFLPKLANSATAPNLVDLLACPPVFE